MSCKSLIVHYFKGVIFCSFFYSKKGFVPNAFRAFSLIEVVLAVGIVAVAAIPLMGLIPASLKNTQISSEETQALRLMTAVVQDFRFTPLSKSRSEIFKLPSLPYNGAQLNTENKVWVDSYWMVYPYNQKPSGQAFELEWKYGVIPEQNSFAAVEATFVVRWPATVDETSGSQKKKKVGGEVSCLAAFPRPRE